MYTGYGSVPGGTPMAIIDGPPPEELPDFYGIPIGDSRRAEAGAWISRRLHELNMIADKVRILPVP